MDFTRRKLPMTATANLRICPVETVQPFALMLAPVYVFMRRNEKFVSIKAPLDFFTEEELGRLRSFEIFYFPDFVDSALPFRQVARRAKALLKWDPDESKIPLPPAPFEISDAIIRTVGPLWSPNRKLEPFFATVFANELCELLPGEELLQARDRDLKIYERAVILSGWIVFFGLHLGIVNSEYLNAIRLRSFRKIVSGASDSASELPSIGRESDLGELLILLDQSLPGDAIYGALDPSFFGQRDERVARKLVSRLKRVQDELIDATMPPASVVGERGFIDG
jgi:hypothetical protein